MEQVKCKSCGATHEIAEDQNCDFCGTLMIFKESIEYYDAIISGEFGNFSNIPLFAPIIAYSSSSCAVQIVPIP